jgi:hypothetical protein
LRAKFGAIPKLDPLITAPGSDLHVFLKIKFFGEHDELKPTEFVTDPNFRVTAISKSIGT